MNSNGVRLADLVASLSIASDLGMGQPLEFALKSCVLALRLGDALGMSEAALREVYYQALLRYIGCNADTHLLAAIVGDELALRRDFARIDNASTGEIVRLFIRYIQQANRGAPALAAMRSLAGGIMALPEIKASFAGHCEVAQRLAARLGFDENVVYSLGQLYERWDGKGAPHGLKAGMISPPVLVVTLAQDALVFYQLEGVEAAMRMARQRRGSIYSPQVADVFLQKAAGLFAGLEEAATLETLLASEPGEHSTLNGEALDHALEALADFVDIKSTFTLGHSTAVARLAENAARAAGLPGSDQSFVYRAGLIHDLGRTGVSSSIWDKPAALSAREWEQVRLHPYYTERIFSNSAALSPLGALASLHHERLDGTGYYRSLTETMLPVLARILAAADVYHAMLENRPHRPACSPDQAREELKILVRSGKLDGQAVAAILGSVGGKMGRAAAKLTGGLSEREIEVLRLLARGATTRRVAEALVISPKTADHHIQNMYTKMGVSTRAGATLYALEHHLLEMPPDEE
jgi:HD-GYP domain-containing protein (c-di-GMP phosphodiesterase class II)